MDVEILRYVEPVYRFCLKRVSSHADAEDLAQEILLCVLQGRRRAAIANLDGYVWRVAHNRYAKRLDIQNRDVMVLCGDEYLMGIPQEAAEEADEGFPPRKDGGNGWFIVHEGVDRLDEYDAGCNGYRYDANGGQPGKFLYYWIGDTFSESLNDTLHNARFFLNAVGGDGTCTFGEETDAAKAFANGLCENRGGRIYSSIPVFTKKQYTDFSEWVGACSAIDSLWQKWIDALFSAYRSFTPGRLADQIGGNVDGYSFNLSAFVLKELRNRGAADRLREGRRL